jgi:quercetin dioxygenase-like cupin family protein
MSGTLGARDAISNVATGETYEFLARANATQGELLRLRWSANPGGRVGEHIHPLQEERFNVTDGELTVSIEGEESVFGPGQTASAPAGKRHFFANRGEQPVTAILEIRPALRMEEVFESLAGYAREGKAKDDGLPRDPLLLSVFADEFKDEIRGVKPPLAIQRAVLPWLAALGRRLGREAHPERYSIPSTNTV